MLKLIKILPLLVAVGGGAAMSNKAGRFVDRVSTRVKVLMTGIELRSIADGLRMKFLDSGTVPGLDRDDDFREFMQDNFETRRGGRDPSVDLFGNDYRISGDNSREISATLYSTGPNGNDDECVLLDGETLQLEYDLAQLANLDPTTLDLEKLGLEESDLEDLDLTALDDLPLTDWQKEEILKEAMPDDLCISLEFALRDTPFRSLD
jgi:hypothetical protein